MTRSLSLSILVLISSLAPYAKADGKIPFPDALDDAAIRLKSLDRVIDDALIVGNGDINALVYSENGVIVMNLTKNDVWDARLETLHDPPIPTLNLIKQLGASDTAFPLRDSNSGSVLPGGKPWKEKDSYHATPYPCPRQCARIRIGGESPEPTTEKMNAVLDIRRAAVTVRGITGGPPKAVIRALADRNVFLVETASTVQLLAVQSKNIPPAESGNTGGISWIKQRIPGDLDWPGMEFAVAATPKGDRKTVAIVTSFESKEVVPDAVALAKRTLQANRDALIRKHVSEWGSFWSKSGIKIDDELLQRTWYRSLYFLRCVSKPGVQSVGLFAGLVNDTPAWHGDYHTNYNLQQTYWAAYPANHPELAEPYDRLMAEYLPRAKWLCQQVFSMDGAYYPHVLFAYEPPNPAACKSRNGRQYLHHTWGMTLGVDGFSIQPMWWRYKYDPDPDRLKKVVYPALRAVALFYSKFIEQCEGDKTVRLGPSVSPEHWGWTKHLDRNYNCAFDIAMVRYTLNAALEAAQTLGRDQDLAQRCQKALQRLPDYPLYGASQPVVVDVEGAPPITYNISVPATPVFPGDVVTWWSSGAEKELFTRTIEKMRWNGNNATFMLAISRARLSMPGTQEWLRAEVEARTRPNGTMALNRLTPHHAFNDFGHYTEQFGAGMAVSEILLQSAGDTLRLFPALAPGCRAQFTDLRTQGGFLVTAECSADTVKSIQIKCPYGGPLRLLSPWRKIEARNSLDQPYKTLEQNQNGVVTVNTRPGETWHFRRVR